MSTALVDSDGCAMPCIALPTMHGRRPANFLKFADALVEGWSAFNNLPIERRGLDEIQSCVTRPIAGGSSPVR